MAETSFDLVFTGGTVVDGTGAARYSADVGVSGDRITAIGDLSDSAAGRRVDASNRVIAPGFIDVHTHDDRALLANPTMDMKASQGVTSVVVGNCGVSLAPLTIASPPPPLDLIFDARTRFPTFGAFIGEVEKEPAAVNAAFLVGHSTLRAGVMDTLDRPADKGEIAAMRDLLDEGLGAGAVGMSTGLWYKPAANAPTEEIIEIGRVLEAHGARYVTHMRNEADGVMDSLEETFRIGRETHAPVVVSHHKVVGKDNFGRSKETLAFFAKEKEHGHNHFSFDVYPYHASSTILREDMIGFVDRILVTWSHARPEFAGRELSAIAAEMNLDEIAAARELQPAGAIYFSMDEEDVQAILSHPDAMIGSDGLPHDEHPHPRLWGTFPRVLGHYCRELGLFSLEEAVRRMTGLSAKNFGLKDRGEIRVGAYADLCVFDPKTVLDEATFDAPKTPASGIDTVWVNGRCVWEGGASTGARPGMALRRGG